MNSDMVRKLVEEGKINCPFCGTKPGQVRALLQKIWDDYGKREDLSVDALERIERFLASAGQSGGRW